MAEQYQPSHRRVCKSCGNGFVSHTATATYCSIQCHSSARPRAKEHACPGCGEMTNRPIWCSTTCRTRRAQERAKERRESEDDTGGASAFFAIELGMVDDGYLPLPHGLTQAGRPLFSLAEVADIIGIDAIRLNETLIKIGPRFRYRENGQRDS